MSEKEYLEIVKKTYPDLKIGDADLIKARVLLSNTINFHKEAIKYYFDRMKKSIKRIWHRQEKN